MARSKNKVTLLGNLGDAPEIRYLPNGTAVANFSLATSETWKDKNTGQPVERTEWHNLVAYGRLAEVMGEYLGKGSKIDIEGKLKTRKWQDKNTGENRYKTEIEVGEMIMLDGKGQQQPGHNQGHNQGQQQWGQRQGQGQHHQGQHHQGQNQHHQAQNQPPMDSFQDEEIPF